MISIEGNFPKNSSPESALMKGLAVLRGMRSHTLLDDKLEHLRLSERFSNFEGDRIRP
jgi:hypothetical protein